MTVLAVTTGNVVLGYKVTNSDTSEFHYRRFLDYDATSGVISCGEKESGSHIMMSYGNTATFSSYNAFVNVGTTDF